MWRSRQIRVELSGLGNQVRLTLHAEDDFALYDGNDARSAVGVWGRGCAGSELEHDVDQFELPLHRQARQAVPVHRLGAGWKLVGRWPTHHCGEWSALGQRYRKRHPRRVGGALVSCCVHRSRQVKVELAGLGSVVALTLHAKDYLFGQDRNNARPAMGMGRCCRAWGEVEYQVEQLELSLYRLPRQTGLVYGLRAGW